MDGKEGNFSALTSTYGKADTTIIKKKNLREGGEHHRTSQAWRLEDIAPRDKNATCLKAALLLAWCPAQHSPQRPLDKTTAKICLPDVS